MKKFEILYDYYGERCTELYALSCKDAVERFYSLPIGQLINYSEIEPSFNILSIEELEEQL